MEVGITLQKQELKPSLYLNLSVELQKLRIICKENMTIKNVECGKESETQQHILMCPKITKDEDLQ